MALPGRSRPLTSWNTARMGDLKVTIEHGSPLSRLLNAKTLLIGAAVVVIGASGSLSGVESGLTSLVEWVAVIVAVVVAVVVAFAIRATRHHRSKDYVRSIHGPTKRDQALDELAEIRRQIAISRAARYQLEVERLVHGHFPADYTVHAEIVDPKG